MKWIGMAFVAAVVVFVGAAVVLTADTLQVFAAALADLALLYLRICAGLLALAGGVLAWWWVARTLHERNRQRDGAFAVREYWLEPWPRRLLNTLAGRVSVRVLVDINTLITHGAAIGAFGVHPLPPAGDMASQLEYAREVERTRRVQAAVVGDAVHGNPLVQVARGVAGVPNAATGRLLAGAYDKTPRSLPPPIDTPQLPSPGPVDVSLGDALHQGDAQNWPLGFAADGGLAAFAPLRHAHAAVVGATGTGKTTSTGYLLAAHALRYGWHVIVLDGDNGNAWTPFAAHAEHVEADADVLPDQVAVVYREFERRARLLADAGVADMLNLSAAPARLLCVVEEYGDLARSLRLRSPAGADQVNAQLDTILRRGRKCGVHMALIDQYPEHWSNQVLAGVKWLAAFRLGPNQGAKVQEYEASSLPDRGAFMHRRVQYTAWHAEPAVRQLLAAVPALPVGARLLGTGGSAAFGAFGSAGGGGSTSGGERPAEQPAPNAGPASPTDLQAAVWAWRDAHPDGAQADMRRAFEAAGVQIARGYAHELWHAWQPLDCEGRAHND